MKNKEPITESSREANINKKVKLKIIKSVIEVLSNERRDIYTSCMEFKIKQKNEDPIEDTPLEMLIASKISMLCLEGIWNVLLNEIFKVWYKKKIDKISKEEFEFANEFVKSCFKAMPEYGEHIFKYEDGKIYKTTKKTRN